MKNTKEKPNIHKDHRNRMRETFINAGFSAFSDVQKLEFMLFFAIPRIDVNPLAHALLDKFGNIDNVINADYIDLMSVKGVGKNTAILIKTFYAVNKNRSIRTKNVSVNNCIEAKNFFYPILKDLPVEEFYALCLDANNNILHLKKFDYGTPSKVQVAIKEITQTLLSVKAAKLIIAHNHPSDKLQFSLEDQHFTHRVLMNCLLNDIEFIDHILVTSEGAIAMTQFGMIEQLTNIALNKLNINRHIFTGVSSTYVPYEVVDKIEDAQLDVSLYDCTIPKL